MNANPENLINNLLNKCEVKNLPQLYKKYLEKNGHICSFNRLYKFNGYFTPSNIKRDISKSEDLLVIKVNKGILDLYFGNSRVISKLPEKQSASISHEIECVTDILGLARIIEILFKKKIIPKKAEIDLLTVKLGIDGISERKLVEMLNKAISSGILFAVL